MQIYLDLKVLCSDIPWMALQMVTFEKETVVMLQTGVSCVAFSGSFFRKLSLV